MKHRKPIALLISLILIFTSYISLLIAAENKIMKKKPTILDNFSYSISTGFSSNLHQTSSPDYSASSSLGFDLGYNLDGIALGASLSATKELTGYRESSIGNTPVYASTLIHKFNEWSSISGTALVLIPTNKDTRHDTSLRTAVSLKPSFKINLKPLKIENLTLVYSPAYTKYFHEFETDISANSNSSYKLDHKFLTAYSLTKNVGLAYSFGVSDSWTYEGNRKSPGYSHTVSANYSYKSLGLSVALGSGGSLYKPNGVDSNFEIFDSNAGYFALSVSYSM
jgi:hypothetical protein